MLKSAIQRAARFIDKTKDGPEVLKALHFLPAKGGCPARVYATDGQVGILVDAGQDLPDMVLPAAPLVKLCKDIAAVVEIQHKGNATASITVAGKAAKDRSEYRLKGLGPSTFPDFPAIPEIFGEVDEYQWAMIKKVCHAAGTDDGKPELQNVHFSPEAVETVDLARVARSELAGSWSGLVPVKMFRHWPKSGVTGCAFAEHHCFFQGVDELRFAVLQKSDRFPDIKALVPEIHEGWWMVLETKSLIELVKKASDLSPTNSIVLDFGMVGLKVRAYARLGDGIAFEASLRAPMGIPVGRHARYSEVLINGKLLKEALAVVSTPRVRICYGAPQEPLRVESGGFVESIWPMLAQPEVSVYVEELRPG